MVPTSCHFERVYYFGAFRLNDAVLKMWQDVFAKNRARVDPLDVGGIPQPGSVILVCYDLMTSEEDLNRIIEMKDCSKVIYVPLEGRGYAAQTAVSDCVHNGVEDVFAADVSGAFPKRLASFGRRLENLCAGRPMHDPIRDVALANGDRVFVATPFDDEIGKEFEDGATHALRGLELVDLNPRNEYWARDSLRSNIVRMIRESKVIVANIRLDKRGRFNPNVFYEMGYGHGRKKAVLAFRHTSDDTVAPVDIREREYFEYENSLDVAMQLYWGLKGGIKNWNSPVRYVKLSWSLMMTRFGSKE